MDVWLWVRCVVSGGVVSGRWGWWMCGGLVGGGG